MPINFFHLRSRYGNQSCNICAQKETFYYLPPNNKYEKEVCCSTTWKVHIPNIGILVGIEESPVSTRQCPWWDARHGRPNSIEYLVLHATWWPGRMVHTHWSSIRILVTVVWHIINSPSPSLWAKMGTAGIEKNILDKTGNWWYRAEFVWRVTFEKHFQTVSADNCIIIMFYSMWEQYVKLF